MALIPNLYNLWVLYSLRRNLFWAVLSQYKWRSGRWAGTSYAYDLLGYLISPRSASLGFLMRLGVVCRADLAVKKANLSSRLLAMLYGEIILIIIAITRHHRCSWNLSIFSTRGRSQLVDAGWSWVVRRCFGIGLRARTLGVFRMRAGWEISWDMSSES